MQPLTHAEIRGNWATLLLPFNADDSIDYAPAWRRARSLHRDTRERNLLERNRGEFHTQTEVEFDRVNQLLAEKCECAGMPFQIGASHMSAQANIAPLITAHGLANPAAAKAAAAAGGWLRGFNARLRWPYRGATEEMVRAIASAARAELPEFFASS